MEIGFIRLIGCLILNVLNNNVPAAAADDDDDETSYRWNDVQCLQPVPGRVVSLRPVNGSQSDVNGA